MSLDEIDDLKNALKQAQREKEELELNLFNLTKEKKKMQLILESKHQQIERDQRELEKESLKKKRTTEGLLSTTFKLDSHNQRLEDAATKIRRLTRWYEKETRDKKVLEEDLRTQIQSLAQASLDQEEKIKYLTIGLQDH